MSSNATRDELLDLLEAGETLLLPNGDAARWLRAMYDARQRARGVAAWQPARAISWQQWTSSVYGELIVSGVESRLLLNSAQELSLWREIIASDPPVGALGSFDSFADLAASAYALAAAWKATGRLRAAAVSGDARYFARWAAAFEAQCQNDRLLPAAALDTALDTALAQHPLAAPKTLRLVGFAELTPSRQQLVDGLRARGTDVITLKPVTATAEANHMRTLCDTPRDELQFAARWLRRTLASTTPPPRIAVVVPGLEDERAALETVLRETLAEELESVATDLSSTPWEFASGPPLQSLAMIADVLDLARWTVSPLPQARVSALLLSPYLNPGAERERAAELDAMLRRRAKRLRPELSLDGFVRLLDRYDSPLAWPRQLQIEVARGGEPERPHTYAAWSEHIRKLVQAAGWPSAEERALNATEYEATRAWDGLLDTVATLDFAGRRVPLNDALTTLERLAAATRFQPPATHANIQILQPQQAEAALFDSVLYLHATDQNLPAPLRPNPLLPLALQSELKMPGTDSARTTEDARSFLQGLLDSTSTVAFACAREDEDGALRPSPLLDELDLMIADDDDASAHASRIILPCEQVADDASLPPLPTHEIAGGSRVLQLQAACGFRAFAELRLGAAEPENSEMGLDARQSGSLIHKVLQLLWTPQGEVLRSQAELAEMTAAERRVRLEDCIDAALLEERRASAADWDAAYLAVVRERLLTITTQWLEHELRRGPFSVLSVERDEPVYAGPLKLMVRVDRLDRVPMMNDEGERAYGHVLVDYKTRASANPAQWMGERPEEPQVPLYTLQFGEAAAEEIKAVAFGKILAGDKMGWQGVQAEDGVLPRAKIVDMPALIDEWSAELARLGHAFADGDAAVAPKDPVTTCEHCGLKLLCRVGEMHLATADDADEETSGDE